MWTLNKIASSALVVLIFCLLNQAEADIIFTDVDDVTYQPGTDIHINPYTGQAGNSTFGGEQIIGWFGYNENEYPLLYGRSFVRGGANTGLAKLDSGEEIGASSAFGNTDGMYFELIGGEWQGGGTGYTGFRLNTAGGYNYGYLHFRYDDAENSVTLLDMSIETTDNLAITAGGSLTAIPEPNSVVTLLLGLSFVVFFGYRRKD